MSLARALNLGSLRVFFGGVCASSVSSSMMGGSTFRGEIAVPACVGGVGVGVGTCVWTCICDGSACAGAGVCTGVVVGVDDCDVGFGVAAA